MEPRIAAELPEQQRSQATMVPQPHRPPDFREISKLINSRQLSGMPPRRFEYSIGRLERRRQWFLTDDELAGLEPGHDQFLVGRGRCADGHQLDIWTAEQRPIVAISERDEVPGCGAAQ